MAKVNKPRKARRTWKPDRSDRVNQCRPERSRQALVLGSGRIVNW